MSGSFNILLLIPINLLVIGKGPSHLLSWTFLVYLPGNKNLQFKFYLNFSFRFDYLPSCFLVIFEFVHFGSLSNYTNTRRI